LFVFFFSSRRRHTRFSRDWSSDVCSSDLTVMDLITREPELTDLVLVCPAVNLVDASALESLETTNERLRDAGVRLHLSEVKGPVMDRLKDTEFLQHLGGQVHLSTYEAWRVLTFRGALA